MWFIVPLWWTNPGIPARQNHLFYWTHPQEKQSSTWIETSGHWVIVMLNYQKIKFEKRRRSYWCYRWNFSKHLCLKMLLRVCETQGRCPRAFLSSVLPRGTHSPCQCQEPLLIKSSLMTPNFNEPAQKAESHQDWTAHNDFLDYSCTGWLLGHKGAALKTILWIEILEWWKSRILQTWKPPQHIIL